MSIVDIKSAIIENVQKKYTGKAEEPFIKETLKGEIASILAKSVTSKEIRTFTSLFIQIKDKTVRVRANLYPIFIGSIIRFDFNIGL